jgi:hypothetical protein
MRRKSGPFRLPTRAARYYLRSGMDLRLTLEPHDVLVVHLREGVEATSVPVHPARAGAASLLRAVGAAMTDGYGECFWPGSPGGQYWWIFKREAEALETIAMWTRGGASLWEHVFRATDSASFVEERLGDEVARLGLGAPLTDL